MGDEYSCDIIDFFFKKFIGLTRLGEWERESEKRKKEKKKRVALLLGWWVNCESVLGKLLRCNAVH